MSQEERRLQENTRRSSGVEEATRTALSRRESRRIREREIKRERRDREKETNWKRGAQFNQVAIGATSDVPTAPSAGSEDSVRKPIPSGGLRASKAMTE